MWISPDGQDITHSNVDPFDTVLGNEDNPGHLRISLSDGQTIALSNQGVYACVIPDHSGDEQTVFVGIYPAPRKCFYLQSQSILQYSL